MTWNDRADRATRSLERSKNVNKEEVAAEAMTVGRDLGFLFSSIGLAPDRAITHDREGLQKAEDAYRAVASKVRSDELKQLERLLGVLLGQSIIDSIGGRWVVYDGKYHTMSPVVVRLKNGKHLDVLTFGIGLTEDKSVLGGRSGQSLVKFFDTIEKKAFP